MNIITSIARELRHPDYPKLSEILQVLGIVMLLSVPDLVML